MVDRVWRIEGNWLERGWEVVVYRYRDVGEDRVKKDFEVYGLSDRIVNNGIIKIGRKKGLWGTETDGDWFECFEREVCSGYLGGVV